MQPLADTLRRSPVPPGEALALAAALAEALVAKVRDKTRPPRITPGTVMIEKRADGSVAVEFKSGALPAPSGPVGADERAAVQELGVICYRLLTGKPPIKGNVGLIRDLEAAVASSPQPDALKALVLELISVDPARRPGLENAAERLVAIARGIPLPPSGPAPLPPPPRAGGGTRPPPTPKPMPALPTAEPARPAPPPITVQPVEPPADLVPAAPILPVEPVVVAATSKSKKKKNSTDTQERLFFAEGERLAAEERADAGILEDGAVAAAAGDDATDLDVDLGGAPWWRNRSVVIIGGAVVGVAVVLVLFMALRGGGGDDETPEDEPLAAAAPAATAPADSAKVASAEPAAAPAPEPPAPAPAPEPAPEPSAAAPEPPPEPEPAPPAAAPEPRTPAKKPSSSSKSSSRASAAAKAAPPAPKPKDPPKPAASSDPLAQAKAARARGRHSEAYSHYAQAAKKNPAAGTFGMAEMAYAMKKYGDAISLAKKAMSKGASEKACWKIIARSHCARNEGRSAWFAFSKAGGGDCP